ncbi:MAG TPA: folylpolyglutamate synthase/dihydrofolate synthase family protein [Polyangiaceae bacterium]|nr:folylpolyglutamate synthase/dihydrofolate synthase family protein [Polyangiaceae bacterium]
MSARLPSTLQRLYALGPRGMRFDLERVRRAAQALGDLHRVGPYVHIGGTNGKGSTAAFVERMAREAGATVGLYTSPHLCRFSERVRVDGDPVDDDLLADCLERALAADAELTFFEVATLAALAAFRERKVDLWVLEVGLGGRLDATNIVEGKATTAITRVAYDHTDRLGPTLMAIAREKAGILRPGAPCVVGRLHPDALAVVEEVAAEIGARVHEASGEDEAHVVDLYPPSLPGVFQRSNAMVAVAIARALELPDRAIAEGLLDTQWPGRFEILETPEGYVVLDCAHNPDGALALKNSLIGVGAAFSRRQVALVFGAMADKNWRAMLDRLTPVTGPRVYVEPQGRAPASAEELVAYLDGDVALGVAEALALARQKVGRGGLVVVAGSIFLVGQARAHLLGLPVDPPIGL